MYYYKEKKNRNQVRHRQKMMLV